MKWKIALNWIVGSFIVGMALGFMVHPDIGSFVLIAFICLGSLAAIIHYLTIYIRNKNMDRNVKQLVPVAFILAAFAAFALYIYISVVTCDITEDLSYVAAEQFVKMEGFDVQLLKKSGRQILGCNFIFVYDQKNQNKLVIVDRDGNAKFNN